MSFGSSLFPNPGLTAGWCDRAGDDQSLVLSRCPPWELRHYRLVADLERPASTPHDHFSTANHLELACLTACFLESSDRKSLAKDRITSLLRAILPMAAR